jgi:hypothetical protein
MNQKKLRIMTALVGAVLWLTSAVQAQYVTHLMKVSVPFEFTFGDKLFPAGDYVVMSTPIRIELRDQRGQVIATAVYHGVQSLNAAESAKLVFTADDRGHALRQVWPGDPHYGYELAPPSKAAKALAGRRSQPPVQLEGGGGNK